jgi:hypothetical protein
MVTFFTTAKPFTGNNGVIQRNALKSWTLAAPDAEVILLGDGNRAAEIGLIILCFDGDFIWGIPEMVIGSVYWDQWLV